MFQKTLLLRRESELKRMRVSKFPVLEEESGQEESKMEGGREKHRLVTKRGAQAAHRYVGKLGEDVLHVSRGRHGRNVGWVTCDAMKLTWSIIELSLHYGSRRRIFATIGNPSHVVFHTLYSTMRVRIRAHTHTHLIRIFILVTERWWKSSTGWFMEGGRC